MGYRRHHAILVTSQREDALSGAWKGVAGIREAHAKAMEIFKIDGYGMVSEVVVSPINEYYTFMVVPDGSYERWEESHLGDQFRKEFIDWLKAQKFEDGSTPLTWAEIQYADDDLKNRMTDDSDAEARKAEKTSS